MKVYALLLKLETMASVGWGGVFLCQCLGLAIVVLGLAYEYVSC